MPKSVETHYLLAISHLRRLEFDKALTYFRETAELDPKHDDALRNIGFCLLASGDYEGALAAFERSFKGAASAGSLRFIALLRHRLGRVGEAIQVYERLLRTCQATSQEIPFALQGLAAALRAAGRPTIPTTLGVEKATNPFLRADQPTVQAAFGNAGRSATDTFAAIRRGKDNF